MTSVFLDGSVVLNGSPEERWFLRQNLEMLNLQSSTDQARAAASLAEVLMRKREFRQFTSAMKWIGVALKWIAIVFVMVLLVTSHLTMDHDKVVAGFDGEVTVVGMAGALRFWLLMACVAVVYAIPPWAEAIRVNIAESVE